MRVEIGKIDILDNFSYIEVSTQDVNDVLFAFEDKFYKGRPLTLELAQAKKPNKKEKSNNRNSKKTNKKK
jgi:ATP-dependent RNA helicase DeaD